MSTSAIISIRTFDEARQEYKCKTAYLSHDGHIAGKPFAAGEILLKHYNTAELAQGLVDLGGVRAIDETSEKCEVLQGYEPVENIGRDAVTTYAHIEFKYVFNADVNAWFTWFQFPKDHKAEFIRLDYIVRNFVDGVYQSPK